MKPSLTILTGASRGMGLAMARQLLRPRRHAAHPLAHRQRIPGAPRPAHTAPPWCQWSADLAQCAAAARAWPPGWRNSRLGAFAAATLINNAGVIPRIGPLSDAEPDDLAMRCAWAWRRRCADRGLPARHRRLAVPRKVLNISSGLGRRAMASQAAYCAAKAGMDHFTRCLALEEALKPDGAKVCSLAPGVIDTDMQVQLRGAASTAFPDVGNFIGLKDKGLLSSPDGAAAQVLGYLDRPDFGANPVADVRD
jgi:benzil reductase ((S)-benzoin forming)